jgi:hypothetical protein
MTTEPGDPAMYVHTLGFFKSRDNSVGHGDGLRDVWPGFDFRQGQQIFSLTGSRTALLGVTRQELEADHSTPSIAEVKNGLRGVLFNYLRTETTVPLPFTYTLLSSTMC